MNKPIEQHDQRELYCRKLGHHLKFRYCREEQNGLPCRNTLGCWSEHFEVRSFLDEHFSEAQLQAAFKPSKPKMAALLELIQQAQQRG
jgi:hypothetical protein